MTDSTQTTRPLKVVMVGAGFVAPYHAAGWRSCPDVTLAGAVVRDTAEDRRRVAKLGIPTVYQNIAEAVEREKADVVDICSPAEFHETHAIECAELGRDFMCQKPLAPTLEGALRITAAAERAGVRAMVHENFRFRPWNRVLKQAIDDGLIGTPFYARSAQRMAGTVTTAEHPDTPWSLARQPYFRDIKRFLILESVIHQIDVARFLFGEPRRLFAVCRRISPLVQGEDSAMVTLCFDSMDVLIERSYASKGYPQPGSGLGETVAVEGGEGSAFIDEQGEVRIVRDNPGSREELFPVCRRDGAYAASYAASIRHFVDALRAGKPFETSLRDNLSTLRAVFAVYESAASGDTIRITVNDSNKR